MGHLVTESHPGNPGGAGEPSAQTLEPPAPSWTLAELRVATPAVLLPSGVGAAGMHTGTCDSPAPSLQLLETCMGLTSWGHTQPGRGSG